MNDCPNRDLLERLLADRLDDTELDGLDGHVKACASCQQTLEELSDVASWKRALRNEVSLLFEDAEPVVDPLGVTAGARAAANEDTARVVPTVPGYEITGELGRGGMGVVYRARHIRLNRPCALKMILAGAHAGPDDVARFVTEAEAIARLEHPSIVQIHHIGDADGLPYLELEYVSRGSLDRQLDGTPWPASNAAQLAEQVALGIAEAHRLGIVHRDLKPSNVLLAADGTPKVGDFGLAKLLDSQRTLTQSESVMGSPSYMAPEQAQGHAKGAGPPVDIYALGAILYELLTGRPPFRGTTALETLEQVKSTEPVPPSRLVPGMPRDIETICLKCLQKEPARRYETAQALANDLQRFRDGRSIQARRTSGVERAWRWCRRNRLVAGLSGVSAAAILSLAVGMTVAAFTFREQRRQTLVHLMDSLTHEARATRSSGQMGQRFEGLRALDSAARIGRELGLPSDRFDRLRDQAIACLALPDLKPTGWTIEHSADTLNFCVDPDMNRYALRLRSGTIIVRRIAGDHEVARFQARGDRDIGVFCFSPDGRYLMTTHFPGSALTVWDVDRGTKALEDPDPVSSAAAQFSPDSRQIALAHQNGELILYDLETRRRRRLRTGLGRAQQLAFHADGRQIALTADDRKQPNCTIIDVESGQVVRTIPLPTADSISWGPGGATLATANKLNINLWDARSGNKKATLEGSYNDGLHMAFHPAGRLLASKGWEDRLRVWDVDSARPVLNLADHIITQPTFSRDGQIVVESDGRFTAYQADPAFEYRSFVHFSSETIDYQRPAIGPDNRLLAVGSNRGVVLWDSKTGAELAFLPIGSTWQVMFDSNGDLLTSGQTGVQRWPVQLDSERGQPRIGPPREHLFHWQTGQIAADRLGRVIARAASSHAEVQIAERFIWLDPVADCRYVAVSPDGEWLAAGSQRWGAKIWRLRDGHMVRELEVERGSSIHFSPDGKWLMTGCPPCRLWTTGTWALARELGGEGLCVSPDSRLVAILDGGRVVRLVEAETGRVIARLESPDLSSLVFATFSPDGSILVVVPARKPIVHAWDLRAIRQRLSSMRLDWDAPDLPHDQRAPGAIQSLEVDLGPLAGEMERLTETPQTSIERHTARLKQNPNDVQAYHYRGHAFYATRRVQEAIDDFEIALRLRPDDDHVRASLAHACNNRAWLQAYGPRSLREARQALKLSRRAVELCPHHSYYVNTLGIALYRARVYPEAIATLERFLAECRGGLADFELFFVAMAHHRQGHREQARAAFDRAVLWMESQKNAADISLRFMSEFRAEAEAVLAGPAGELPDDVFTPPVGKPRTDGR